VRHLDPWLEDCADQAPVGRYAWHEQRRPSSSEGPPVMERFHWQPPSESEGWQSLPTCSLPCGEERRGTSCGSSFDSRPPSRPTGLDGRPPSRPRAPSLASGWCPTPRTGSAAVDCSRDAAQPSNQVGHNIWSCEEESRLSTPYGAAHAEGSAFSDSSFMEPPMTPAFSDMMPNAVTFNERCNSAWAPQPPKRRPQYGRFKGRTPARRFPGRIRKPSESGIMYHHIDVLRQYAGGRAPDNADRFDYW